MEKPEKLAGNDSAAAAGRAVLSAPRWGDLSTKQLRDKRSDFALHVGLIMRQEKQPKAMATFIAWLEGDAGLVRRLPD